MAWSLSKEALSIYATLLEKVSQYTNVEEVFKARYPRHTLFAPFIAQALKSKEEHPKEGPRDQSHGKELRGRDQRVYIKGEATREPPYANQPVPSLQPLVLVH